MRAKYKIGSLVRVAPDNDNDGYDSFRNKTLRITHVATNRDQHPGYDGATGEALYDMETLDGEAINCSLYDYELSQAPPRTEEAQP